MAKKVSVRRPDTEWSASWQKLSISLKGPDPHRPLLLDMSCTFGSTNKLNQPVELCARVIEIGGQWR